MESNSLQLYTIQDGMRDPSNPWASVQVKHMGMFLFAFKAVPLFRADWEVWCSRFWSHSNVHVDMLHVQSRCCLCTKEQQLRGQKTCLDKKMYLLYEKKYLLYVFILLNFITINCTNDPGGESIASESLDLKIQSLSSIVLTGINSWSPLPFT